MIEFSNFWDRDEGLGEGGADDAGDVGEGASNWGREGDWGCDEGRKGRGGRRFNNEERVVGSRRL